MSNDKLVCQSLISQQLRWSHLFSKLRDLNQLISTWLLYGVSLVTFVGPVWGLTIVERYFALLISNCKCLALCQEAKLLHIVSEIKSAELLYFTLDFYFYFFSCKQWRPLITVVHVVIISSEYAQEICLFYALFLPVIQIVRALF